MYSITASSKISKKSIMHTNKPKLHATVTLLMYATVSMSCSFPALAHKLHCPIFCKGAIVIYRSVMTCSTSTLYASYLVAIGIQ